MHQNPPSGNTTRFDRISLTARLAAYMRQYSDIPYARDIAELLHARESFGQLLSEHQMTSEDLIWYAPIFEVRYKSITDTVRASGLKQVLELASGLSFRGLGLTQDPDVRYIETDLEGLTAEKSQLISILRDRYQLPDFGNLHFVAANATLPGDLQVAAQGFDPGRPIAVVNEGFFPYLSASEMTSVVINIRDLLTEYGGVWITPDFAIKEDVQNVSEQQKQFRRIVAAATDQTMYNNAFDDESQVRTFLQDHGLYVEVVNQLDITSRLASLDVLSDPNAFMSQMKSRLKLWIVRQEGTR